MRLTPQSQKSVLFQTIANDQTTCEDDRREMTFLTPYFYASYALLLILNEMLP